MTHCDYSEIIIYLSGGLFWLYLWHALVGYDWLKRSRLMYLPFLGALFVFASNICLAFFTCTRTYNSEMKIYPYVEQNAKTVAGLALAIALFVYFKFNAEGGMLESANSRKFISLVFWSFLLSVIGCLPLYWIPPIPGWITVLMHLKTVPFTYSIFILATSIILFLMETNKLECIEKEKD